MTTQLLPGAVLVAKGTPLPAPLRLEGDSTTSGWAPVADILDSRQLEKKLLSAGWKFFFMAGAITATASGFDNRKMMQTALKSLIATAKLQKCNCLEIDDIATHSRFGITHISLSAHTRHIQKGTVMSRLERPS